VLEQEGNNSCELLTDLERMLSQVKRLLERSTVFAPLLIQMGNHAKVVFAVKNQKDCDAESNGDDWTHQTIETEL
jgi:hypothetical protein